MQVWVWNSAGGSSATAGFASSLLLPSAFYFLDIQLCTGTPLSQYQSSPQIVPSSPVPKYPAIMCAFLQNTFQCYIRRALSTLTRSNILDSTARRFSSSHFIVKLDVIVKSMDINIRAKGPFLNAETKVTISHFSLSSESSLFFVDSSVNIMPCIFTLSIK